MVFQLSREHTVDPKLNSGSHGFQIIFRPLGKFDSAHRRVNPRQRTRRFRAVRGNDHALPASSEGLARTVFVPNSGEIFAGTVQVGLISVDESMVFDRAAKLHTGIRLRAKDSNFKLEFKISDVAALPNDELITWRIVVARCFPGDGFIFYAPVTHVGCRPIGQSFTIENGLPTRVTRIVYAAAHRNREERGAKQVNGFVHGVSLLKDSLQVTSANDH